jgi:hypothetical protein
MTMTRVEYIHDRVKDISKKNQAGYSSNDEFNRDLRESENMVFEFYYKIFEKTQKISDALSPFIDEKLLPINNGYVTYPADFRHPAEMVYKYIISAPNCDKPVTKEILMEKLQVNEERLTMDSYIRKPSLSKELLYWTQVSKKIRVRPSDLTGSVLLKYFKNPVYGLYKTQIDIQRGVEVYDAATSKDLEWNEAEALDIIDIMLIQKGISIRDTELVQFAMQKMAINNR